MDQLLVGLLLEENIVAIRAITDGIEQLIPFDPIKIAKKLYDSNLVIQEELVTSIAEFFVICGCPTPPNPLDQKSFRNEWLQLNALSIFGETILREKVGKSDLYSSIFDYYFHAYKSLGDADKNNLIHKSQRSVKITSLRLKANINLLCQSIKNSENKVKFDMPYVFLAEDKSGLISSNLKSFNFSNGYMANMILYGANMENVNLIEANLRNSVLDETNLSKAWLNHANLEDVGIKNAKLNETRLSGAKISEFTDFTGSKWWKADFYTIKDGANHFFDNRLLDDLFERDTKT